MTNPKKIVDCNKCAVRGTCNIYGTNSAAFILRCPRFVPDNQENEFGKKK